MLIFFQHSINRLHIIRISFAANCRLGASSDGPYPDFNAAVLEIDAKQVDSLKQDIDGLLSLNLSLSSVASGELKKHRYTSFPRKEVSPELGAGRPGGEQEGSRFSLLIFFERRGRVESRASL